MKNKTNKTTNIPLYQPNVEGHHIPGEPDTPANPLAVNIVECGCCGHYHRADWHGDCRADSERFADAEDAEKRLGKPVVEIDPDSEPFFIPDVALFPTVQPRQE